MRLAIGWIACMLITAGVTLVAQRWERTWLGDWDDRTLATIERGPMSFSNAILFESPGNLIYVIPLLLCVVIVAARYRQPVFAVTIVVSWLLARTLVYWGWHLWDRPRPQVIAGGVAAPPLHSFPSGHMVLSLSVYGLLVWAWCRASGSWVERVIAILVGIAWCAVLGYARVRLGTHWPSDVIGGAIIGLPWVAVMVWALRAVDNPPPCPPCATVSSPADAVT
ncbi:MAG TPA: phosphatase PAP2 family protein [Tepidisphaeraceae bacterium]|nr:phosphatase PAP2 family protein [Tepidisphaeraceae bacterium]